ncbi:hypothetical protein [Chitinophaga solisilvae]|uniref:hypothetical protein n=1 Tax=Chitinophaga solisilvae TaxID=1233460 RepID=UPI001368C30B|nr:hypothetical protein [Chitinophaga solisilvae]
MRTTIKLIILSLFVILSGTIAQAQDSTQKVPNLTSVAHIGFVYPVSSNGRKAGEYTNAFSLHILAGLSKAETGTSIAGISNVVRKNARGAQVAGISNHLGSTTGSATIAGIANIVKGRAEGVMTAGVLNKSASLKGAQVAGFANLADNSTSESVQVAGFLNKSDSVNSSLAGFINMDKHAQVQVAGFINTTGNAHTQVAGFMNIAKKVKGVQVAGFLNIADSSDYPIGLINLVKGGEKQLSISIDESSTTILSFKSGGRTLYGIIGVGYNFKDKKSKYALQGGIGAHLPLLSHFRINLEVTSTSLTDFKRWEYHRASFGAYPAYRFGRKIEVFAGPTFNHVYTKNGAAQDLVSHYFWTREKGNNKFQGTYIGGTLGVQVKL